MTTGNSNAFDAKTDKGSADLYFHYYGMLQHQQNMLQDVTRTGTYNAAILENCADFEGRTVMDVGAGSGILSLFAAQVPLSLEGGISLPPTTHANACKCKHTHTRIHIHNFVHSCICTARQG